MLVKAYNDIIFIRSIHDELLSEEVLAAISKGLGTNDIILVPVSRKY